LLLVRTVLFTLSVLLCACTTVELIGDPSTGHHFNDPMHDGSAGPEMVWLPSGKYRMGSVKYDEDTEDDEFPIHIVDIPRVFAMARYETTVAEFRQFIEDTNHQVDSIEHGGCHAYKGWWHPHKDASWEDPNYPQNDNYPVVCVSWNDAIAYVQWLSRKTGKKYRLPTEAEWEFAVRAGS